jgi:Ca-activated chloride channel family protein
MARLMRCLYCGLLQDEPEGVKTCARCGGELTFEAQLPPDAPQPYVQAQMELDQVTAPAGQIVDRYLLVTVRTPAQIPPPEAPPTRTGRPPLSFTAVLDVSGSMRGQKIAQVKEAIRQALRRLQDDDVLSLIIFADEATCIFEPAPVDSRSRRAVESALQEIEASGRTALYDGLRLAIEKAAAQRKETNLVLLLSDGQANVGETDVETVGYSARQARQRDMIVSTLGVGVDYNEALMAEIATQGGGRFYHVRHASHIPPYMEGELGEVASLAARDAALSLSLPSGAAVFPLSAAYPTHQQGSEATISLGDIPTNLELEIAIRLTLPAQLTPSRLSVEGQLTFRSPAGRDWSTPLNRVTVRFVDSSQFERRDDVVVPVAERVLEQMRAANILGVSQAMARSMADGVRQADQGLVSLREYATLLGDQRASQETEAMTAEFAALRSAPASAKAAVARAYARQRGTRQFDPD